jgi:glycosyltransferase involved in cell wall biosynthesis
VRRVLLVAYFFPPLAGGGAPRAVKLAKYLPAFGWAPHVLTVGDGVWNAVDDSPLAELPPDVTIHRTPFVMAGRPLRRLAGGGKGGATCTEDRVEPEQTSTLARAKAAFRKIAYVPDEFVGWYPFAVRAGKRIVRERGIDAVVSTSPPHSAHLVGKAIASSTGLPWVADFRDLWTRNPGFLHAQGIRGRVERRLERSVVTAATRIVTVTDPFRTNILVDYPALDPDVVRVIPNGFDPPDFEGGELPENLTPAPSCFRVVYTGGWLSNGSPRLFLEALARSIATSTEEGMPIEAIFAGTQQAMVRSEAERAGVSSLVRAVGYLPARKACALQRSADALLLTLGGRSNSPEIIPGKTFQYLGAGRPIIALVPDGAAADLVRKAGAGFVVAPDDVDAVARTLGAMIRAKRVGKPFPGADPTLLASYTRETRTRHFARVLDEVSHG